jgi:transposase
MSASNRHAPYPEQFRAEAAAMVIELGKAQADVCRELGVSKSALSRWVAAAGGTPAAKRAAAGAETARLEREVARLRQENEFLNYRDVPIIQGIQTAGLCRPVCVWAGGGLVRPA